MADVRRGNIAYAHRIWHQLFGELLPTSILSRDAAPSSTASTLRNLTQLILSKSQVALALLLSKICGDLLSAIDDPAIIDLLLYYLLKELRAKLPPMSHLISQRIGEAMWGKQQPFHAGPTVVSDPELQAALRHGGKGEDGMKRARSEVEMGGLKQDKDVFTSSTSPQRPAQRTFSASDFLLHADMITPREAEEEDSASEQEAPFLQPCEGRAINEIVAAFLTHACNSYGVATLLRTQPQILPQEIEKAISTSKILVHRSTGQHVNMQHFLSLLYLALEKLDEVQSATGTTSVGAAYTTTPSSTTAALKKKEGSSQKESSLLTQNTRTATEQLRTSPSMLPVDVADVGLSKSTEGLETEETIRLGRQLKVNFVQNFFKNPQATDAEIYQKLSSWNMVGVLDGLVCLRRWLHEHPFLLECVFIMLIETLLPALFPEINLGEAKPSSE